MTESSTPLKNIKDFKVKSIEMFNTSNLFQVQVPGNIVKGEDDEEMGKINASIVALCKSYLNCHTDTPTTEWACHHPLSIYLCP